MKKLIILLVFILFLSSCSNNSKQDQLDYDEFINSINNQETFADKASLYNLTYELVKTNEEEYRYYIFIDNVKTSMYNVQAMAIEKDVDYSNIMAANVGIFDNTKYNLVPNQINIKNGFYEGIMISGTTMNSSVELYMLIQWKNKDLNVVYKDFIKISITYKVQQ